MNCILWEKAKDYGGYGVTHLNGKAISAHKKAYILAKGPVPAGMVLRHTCHNRCCVNPDHLIVGTQQDNINDKLAAGREARGSDVGGSKLTDEDVLEIRSLRGKMFQREIALKFNITRERVRQIEIKAIEKLKHPSRRAELKRFRELLLAED